MEEPLPAGGSCLLGSLNLSEFVENAGTSFAAFNFTQFKNAVSAAVVGLNQVLDEGIPLHPLDSQKENARDYREIGLGEMGLADMLIKLKLKYGSPASIDLCDEIGKVLADTALHTSAVLAKSEGTYPKYKECVLDSHFVKANASTDTIELIKQYGLRNSQLLTIAPTGTLSTMLDISGGIEPMFALKYTRKTESLNNKETFYTIYPKIVRWYIDAHRLKDETYLPDFFVTAKDIHFLNRVNMQAVWQKHIDASISSTVNLPESATIDDIYQLYMCAWRAGLKGITVYRENCNRTPVLSTDKPKDEPKNLTEEFVTGLSELPLVPIPNCTTTVAVGVLNNDKGIAVSPSDNIMEAPKSRTTLQRGDILQVNDDVIGKKRKLMTGCGSLHCEAFFDPETGDLQEVFFSKGSTGGCQNFMIGLSRMISLACRGGIDIRSIIDQLNSCGTCPSYAVRTATKKDTSPGSCCPIAIGKALKEMYDEVQEEINDDEDYDDIIVTQPAKPISKPIYALDDLVLRNPSFTSTSNKTAPATALPITNNTAHTCPQCGGELAFTGGCQQCPQCGWSKCS
ncbi:MAG TPA: hypothetical protein PLT28_00300 [Saprospiraceae bacterium]|nr:hypothetical protein [Saprospiraceae bacterium]